MRVHEDHVAVAVPATTANLGPGFDSMGMALDLWDEVEVHATTRATSVVVEGEGADDVEKGDDNLIVRALRLALDRVGAPQVGIRMHCTNRIPHSRGLGSSASAIVAGVVAARALIGDPTVLTPDEVLDIGTEMEGHPDNVAPAVLGGATVAWMGLEGTVKRARAVRLDPPDIIRPVAFIPDFELKTSAARAALPSSVPHADACFNVSRAALLTALLSGASSDAGLARRLPARFIALVLATGLIPRRSPVRRPPRPFPPHDGKGRGIHCRRSGAPAPLSGSWSSPRTSRWCRCTWRSSARRPGPGSRTRRWPPPPW